MWCKCQLRCEAAFFGRKLIFKGMGFRTVTRHGYLLLTGPNRRVQREMCCIGIFGQRLSSVNQFGL